MSDDAITNAITGAMGSAGLTEGSMPAETPAAEPVAAEPAADAAEPVEGAADGAADGEATTGEEPAAEDKAEPEGQQPPAEPKRKRGPIPYDRHEAVLTKARREAEARQQELQARIDALAKYETQDYQERLKAMELAETRPDVFVQILRADPRYQQYLREEQRQQAEAAATAAEPPQPDAILPDGSLGYSAEGARKLLDWRLSQERSTFDAELKKVREEIGPVRETFEAQRQYSESLQRMSVVLEEARSQWPDFATHEAAIKDTLGKNPTWSLEKAYIAVVANALKTGVTQAEETARKRLVAEMNARATAAKTTAPPGHVPPAVVAEQTGDQDSRIEAAIRSSMATLK